MTQEELAERFPKHLWHFDNYLQYGRRQGNPAEGLRAYNAALAKWIAEEFGELPEELVIQARALYGCQASDWVSVHCRRR